MKHLYTIGYEGTTLSAFLDELEEAGVEVLLDVRQFAGSRRKGFSKTALASALAKRGIGYVHKKEFGAPKTIRSALKVTGDYGKYFERFNAYLRTQSDALRALPNECKGSVVLMCYERNPAECHRSAVARELGKLVNKEPVHLVVEDAHGRVRETPRLHPRQGVPAS